MKKILIIGQSVTAVKAVEQIRSVDQESEILMIGCEGGLPPLSERFADWISRQIDRDQVVYQNEKFYRNLRLEFLRGPKVARVNLNRKTVLFEDKTKVDADIIIIAGSNGECFSGLKRGHKEGVFSLKTVEQVMSLQGILGRVETAVVESPGLKGMMFARALAALGKEVVLCLPGDDILPGSLDKTVSDVLIFLLQQSGIRVARKSPVHEILGDDDVRAVRLGAGKVIAAEVVIFPDALPDMRLYNREALTATGRIATDHMLRTGCDGVFAIDDMTDDGYGFGLFCDYDSLRLSQSRRLAAEISGIALDEAPVMRQTVMNLSGREIVLAGDICPDQADIVTFSDPDGVMRGRIFLKNNIVSGAFLVDNTAAADQVIQRIKTGQCLNSGLEEMFSGCKVTQEAFSSGHTVTDVAV